MYVLHVVVAWPSILFPTRQPVFLALLLLWSFAPSLSVPTNSLRLLSPFMQEQYYGFA